MTWIHLCLQRLGCKGNSSLRAEEGDCYSWNFKFLCVSLWLGHPMHMNSLKKIFYFVLHVRAIMWRPPSFAKHQVWNGHWRAKVKIIWHWRVPNIAELDIKVRPLFIGHKRAPFNSSPSRWFARLNSSLRFWSKLKMDDFNPQKRRDPPWNQAPQRLGICQGQTPFTSAHWSPFRDQCFQSVWPPLQLWYKISRILNTVDAVSCVRCKVQISRNPAFGSDSSHAQSNHGIELLIF